VQIVWPQGLVAPRDDAAVRSILIHELAHIRRCDHWTAWLALITRILWWWNPIYQFAERRLRAASELACDMWVIQFTPGGRRAYSELLIEMSRRERPRMAPVFVGVAGSCPRNIERRLTMIMTQQSPRTRIGWGVALVVLVVVAAIPALQLSAAPDEASAQPATAAESDGQQNPSATAPAALRRQRRTLSRRTRLSPVEALSRKLSRRLSSISNRNTTRTSIARSCSKTQSKA
jgi:beta-lactamase regulating signal transducer with metallopeptidase domain